MSEKLISDARLEQVVTKIKDEIGSGGGGGNGEPLPISKGGTGNTDGYIRTGQKSGTIIGSNATIEGTNNEASANSAHAEGDGTKASGQYSHAEGKGSQATGPASHAEGQGRAYGTGAHAEGNSIAEADISHAEGYQTSTTNKYAHSEGEQTSATAQSSHAEGQKTESAGFASHSEGIGCIANGKAAHAEGFNTVANGKRIQLDKNRQTAEGNNISVFCQTISDATLLKANDKVSCYCNKGMRSNLSVISVDKDAGKIVINDPGYYNNTTYICIIPNKSLSDITTQYGHAEGEWSIALDTGAHAEGMSLALGQYSHTEGYGTIADNKYAHAEGKGSQATGQYSHAEGQGTEAWSYGSHAEGFACKSGNMYAHAEGEYSIAGGEASHAEGWSSRTFGEASHAEGKNAVAKGNYSHAEGYNIASLGANSHAEGDSTIAGGRIIYLDKTRQSVDGENGVVYCKKASDAKYVIAEDRFLLYSITATEITRDERVAIEVDNATGKIVFEKRSSEFPQYEYLIAIKSEEGFGEGAHAEGNFTVASGSASHAEGKWTKATADQAHAEGYKTIASAQCAHAEGNECIASDFAAHAEGYKTVADIYGAHAEGEDTKASNRAAHAEGYKTIASGSFSHAEGGECIAKGGASHAAGMGTIAKANSQYTIGQYNREMGDGYQNTDAMFIVGNGNRTTRSNCFRVGYTSVWGGTYQSSGADYAEMFEWEDGNPNDEDRVGRFVTLDGELIRYATKDDLILGITSAAPSVCGDTYDDQWQGMYERDIFGRIVFEDVKLPPEVIGDGTRLIPARIERRQKINPHYKSTEDYQGRSKRKEWAAVGIVGKLVMLQDGTLSVNDFVSPGENGIGTKSETPTNIRVMKVLDDSHVKVFIISSFK